MVWSRKPHRKDGAPTGGVAARMDLEDRSGDQRRPYVRPQLEDYGDLRDLTLGGSPPGVDDSAFPNTRWK